MDKELWERGSRFVGGAVGWMSFSLDKIVTVEQLNTLAAAT